jgi:hypothetical protein
VRTIQIKSLSKPIDASSQPYPLQTLNPFPILGRHPPRSRPCSFPHCQAASQLPFNQLIFFYFQTLNPFPCRLHILFHYHPSIIALHPPRPIPSHALIDYYHNTISVFLSSPSPPPPPPQSSSFSPTTRARACSASRNLPFPPFIFSPPPRHPSTCRKTAYLKRFRRHFFV